MSRVPQPWQRESNGVWYVQIDRKQVYLGKNKKAAFEKYHRLMTQAGGQATTITARQVILAYWEWLKSNRKQTTASSREKILQSFSDSLPGTLKAEAIKPYHVQRWIDGNKNIKSPTTAAHRIGLIVGVFSWAKRMGYVSENPLEDMPKPRRKVRQEFLPVDAWTELLKHCTDECFRLFCHCMLGMGCRVTEIIRFEVQHYDPVGKRFVLPIEDSKGNRTSRVVYVPADLVSEVEQLVHDCPEGKKLFRNSRGKAWNRNSVRCRFRRLKEKMGMPGLTATTLRHSYAHHRLTIGQDALTVAKLMGHTDTRMIATRYGHLDANADYMRNAANAAGPVVPPDNVPSQSA